MSVFVDSVPLSALPNASATTTHDTAQVTNATTTATAIDRAAP